MDRPPAPSRAGLSDLPQLSARQRALLASWLPGATVVRDHSWGLVERAVLEVTRGGSRFIVKAGGPEDNHMAREIRAHLTWLEPWTRRGRAPQLVHSDREANLLVTRYLPGELVVGTPYADDPAVHRRAGALLALLHEQPADVDPGFEASANRRALAWLDGPHRIPGPQVEHLRTEISSWPTAPATVVPTHGDWGPRNWLVHEGEVRVIDFGRAGLRPAMTDLTRLAAQDWLRDPRLEEAFVDGYGRDPREPDAWHRVRVREAIGTAAWAHLVGDVAFEAQGHRMIADALQATKMQNGWPARSAKT